MAKFWRYISEPKTLSRLSFFSLRILSKTRQLTAQKSKSSLATSTRILIFLKPHTFLHELAASAQTKPVNLVTGTPLFWKRSPEPFKNPSTQIRIKKNVWFQKFLDSCGQGLISSFTSLGSRLFIGDDFRWRNLWEIAHAYRREKNYYYWTTGSSVRQDMNNVTVLKFQALCHWYI